MASFSLVTYHLCFSTKTQSQFWSISMILAQPTLILHEHLLGPSTTPTSSMGQALRAHFLSDGRINGRLLSMTGGMCHFSRACPGRESLPRIETTFVIRNTLARRTWTRIVLSRLQPESTVLQNELNLVMTLPRLSCRLLQPQSLSIS